MRLFQRHIEPRCTYCQFGQQIPEGPIACAKRGMMAPDSSCRSFRYDPLKRVPPRPAPLPQLELTHWEDISLFQ